MKISQLHDELDIIVAAGFRGYLLSGNLLPGIRIIETRSDALPTIPVGTALAAGRVRANSAGGSLDAAHARCAPESDHHRRPVRFRRPLQQNSIWQDVAIRGRH